MFKVDVRHVIQERFKAGLLREELIGEKHSQYSLRPSLPNFSLQERRGFSSLSQRLRVQRYWPCLSPVAW